MCRSWNVILNNDFNSNVHIVKCSVCDLPSLWNMLLCGVLSYNYSRNVRAGNRCF